MQAWPRIVFFMYFPLIDWLVGHTIPFQITYEAKVTVPAWATCLMSALQSAEPQAGASGEKRTFSWKQSVPMPSYLIAVAVGELESREISARCVCVSVCVWMCVCLCL